MIRSGNPALSKKTFENLIASPSGVMTIDGAVNKTAISMAILLLSAYYTYTNAILDYVIIGFVGGFIVALITIFKKEWSATTVPIYAFLEGLALGGISKIYADAFEPGIVPQAIMLTLGILFALLFAYNASIELAPPVLRELNIAQGSPQALSNDDNGSYGQAWSFRAPKNRLDLGLD